MATRANTNVTLPIRQLFLRRENEGLIKDQVSPAVFVDESEKKGQYPRYDDSNIVLEVDRNRTGRGGSNETSHGYTLDSYNIQDKGLKEFIDGDIYNYAIPAIKEDARNGTVLNLKDKLLIGEEKDLADMLTNTSNFTGHYSTLSGDNQWSSDASNVLANFKTARAQVKSASGYVINTVILSDAAKLALQFNPSLIDLIGDNTLVKVLTDEMLGHIFSKYGLNIKPSRVLVGSADYKVDKDSAASPIWNKDAIFAYIDPRQNQKGGDTLCKTFKYKSQASEKYYFFNDADMTKKGEWAAADTAYDQKLVNFKCAYLFKNASA